MRLVVLLLLSSLLEEDRFAALEFGSLLLGLLSSSFVDLEAEKLTFCGRSGREEEDSNRRESGAFLLMVVVVSEDSLLPLELVPNKLCVNDILIDRKLR